MQTAVNQKTDALTQDPVKNRSIGSHRTSMNASRSLRRGRPVCYHSASDLRMSCASARPKLGWVGRGCELLLTRLHELFMQGESKIIKHP